MADSLRAGLSASNRARLAWDTVSNEVFAIVARDAARVAEEKGARFYEWPVPAETPDLLDESGTFGSRRKEILDSVSATVILDDYLAWRKEHPGEI